MEDRRRQGHSDDEGPGVVVGSDTVTDTSFTAGDTGARAASGNGVGGAVA